MRAPSLMLMLALIGCGAPPSTPPEPAPTAGGEADAAPAPVEAEPTLAARVLARVEAHLEALRAAPREVGGEEAFALSSAIMDAIDAERLEGNLRDRADDAAEAILTDRSAEGAVRAAEGAVEVLREIVDGG